jgi:hypothetical protein
MPWAASHAALPVPTPAPDGRTRIWFSPRDAEGRARIARVDVDLADPQAEPRFAPDPVVEIGPLGAFDDSGVTASCVVEHEGRLFQYFTGWSLGVTVPFTLFIGCAVSDDGGETFHKPSPAPVLGRSGVDPFLTASPSVLVEDGLWRMWYVSGTEWRIVDGRPKHWYHVKYAESRDGLEWKPTGRVAIDYEDGSEYAIARPWVVRDDGRYRMWFCARGERYLPGYAESSDGLHWERDDALVGLGPSETGWDSEMVAYPAVFDAGGRRYLAYNGNGYGATGIGYAELVAG